MKDSADRTGRGFREQDILLPVDYVPRLAGSSAAVRKLEQEIEWAGRCESKVLITGESGVGKEVVAGLIHERSNRRGRRMLAINCAGFPDTLLESELFGHRRGSFTGAFRDKPGLFEAAHRSTLFMDEVCEMSLRMQALLLRFLETGETRRVGAEGAPGRVDVRIIAATNRDVSQRIAAGEFREDLYFRLNVIHVDVPPLRERPEDIPVLLDYFVELYARKRGIDPPQVGPGVIERLVTYRWPGNIRELRNVAERMMVQMQEGVITVDALPQQFRAIEPPRQRGSQPHATTAVAEVLYDRMVGGGGSFWEVVHEPFIARDLTRHDVRETVRLGLEETKGSYRAIVELFNMQPEDYKRFLNFLKTFGCHLPFSNFRTVPVRANHERKGPPSARGLKDAV
jgi:transcriptional regulator with PAS, ATPase and Fis domain